MGKTAPFLFHTFYPQNKSGHLAFFPKTKFTLYQDPSNRPKRIVDVGCGIGGSSRYLARKYGAKCRCITLSLVQAGRANAQGLADQQVCFKFACALNQPFPDDQFDLVWSMESGEHMPDKPKFVKELVRVAAPGGTIIVVTWCHRDLGPSAESLQPWEQKLLNRICDAYYLPQWCSTSDYVKLFQSLSLQNTFQKEKFVEHNANALAAGRVAGIDPIEQITKRSIRIIKTPEIEVPSVCLLCRRSVKDQDFGGMYCAILTVKIFGQEVAEVPLVATSTEGEGQAIFAHSQQGVPMGYVILIVTAFELFKFELIFFFMVHTLAFCSGVLDSLAVELN
ncbi:hypothetical protein J1N35_033666 [Gossypium stocksii]|uniref:Methyltransferase type 11 domain-containing protein n=1 Tax=Gossypium stocksii TaxID=47602 RepID=A0A9D3UQU0_9ROSI|nr:hypothetical protein J1N35_033666 [Gossypium stocksii]